MIPVLPIIISLGAAQAPMTSVPAQDELSTATSTRMTSDAGVVRIESSEIDSTESEVDRRLREALNAANTRYWKNRVRMKTLPDDHWTPQQAGWVDASGRFLVVNWPWWAW